MPTVALDPDLRTRAELVGVEWAERWFEHAEREHRLVAGGWPGTMSEARAQVVQALVPWLRERGRWPTTEVTNFEATARVVYSSARAAWRRRSVAEPSLPGAHDIEGSSITGQRKPQARLE